MKRIIPLLLALVLVACWLPGVALTASAASTNMAVDIVYSDVYTTASSGYLPGLYPRSSYSGFQQEYFQILYYLDSEVLFFGFNSSYELLGLFWDDNDKLCYGSFLNSTGSLDSSLLGVRKIDDFVLISSTALGYYYNTDAGTTFSSRTSRYVFRSENDSSYSSDDVILISSTLSTGGVPVLFGKTFGGQYVYFILYCSFDYYPGTGGSFVYDTADGSGDVFEDVSIKTSFAGQSIHMTSDTTANLFIYVGAGYSSPTVDWYRYGADADGNLGWSLYNSYNTVYVSNGGYIQAWQYTPDPGGGVAIWKAVVNYTYNGESYSYETEHVTFVISDSGGDGSTDPTEATTPTESTGTGDSVTSGQLQEIETSLEEVQDAVSDVSDKIDNLQGSVDDLLSGGEAGSNLNNSSGVLDQNNDSLNGVVGDLEDAGSSLPTVPDDLGNQIQDNLGSFNDSNISNLMPWADEEYVDFWDIMLLPSLSALTVSLLLYFVFGKAKVG